MPLPDTEGRPYAWPPKPLEDVLPKLAEWSAWYAGDSNELARQYGAFGKPTGPRPRPADHAAGDPSGGQLLVELVHSDLELRLRAGEPARVEQYLAAHPELAARSDAVAGLVAAEYRLRRRRDPGTPAAEYARQRAATHTARFHELAAALEADDIRRAAALATELRGVDGVFGHLDARTLGHRGTGE